MATTSVSDTEPVRSGARALTLASVAVLAGLIAIAGGVALLGNPHAGDPVVTVALKLPAPVHVARANPAPGSAVINATSGPPDENAQTTLPAPDNTTPSNIVPPPPANSGEPKLPANLISGNIAKPVYAGRALVADPALIEETSDGPLPRIADSG